MTLASSIKKGEQDLEKDEYKRAIELFSEALKESSTSYKALIGRSTAHLRLKQYDESLQDLTRALKVAKDRNNSEQIALAYLRLSIQFFTVGELGKSLKAINQAKLFKCADASLPIWLTKITKALTKKNVIEEEFENLVLDTAAVSIKETVTSTPLAQPKMSYYQSSEKLTIDFFYKNITDPIVEFQPTALNVNFKTPSGSNVIYEYKLFAPILPDQCSFKVMSTKVEVTLVKKQQGKWSSLEGSGADLTTLPTISNTTSTPLLYPTSSKSMTNWSKFQVDSDEEDQDDNDDENAFFKKLYAGADEDTKRAMMKSFIESNGTALSTNWGETKEKNWETSPPEGVEAKKW